MFKHFIAQIGLCDLSVESIVLPIYDLKKMENENKKQKKNTYKGSISPELR